MNDIVLSREELKALARSRTRAGQARFLQKNGIKHYLDAHGWPVVLRSSVHSGTGVQSTPAWKSNKAS